MNHFGIGHHGAPKLELPLSSRLLQARQTNQSDQATSFIDLVQSGVANVNATQQHANHNVQELLTGGDITEVEVFTSVQKADLAFRMLVQVRNKLMQAYEEINAIRI